MRTTWPKLVNSSRDLLSFGVFTRSPHRFPPANWHKRERIPASIIDGLDAKFSEIYLFGWKQEVNSVRRILGACHLRKSHDASRALSASPTTPLLPPQTQDSRLRRGRWHSIWRFWVSSCFHWECRCEFHGLDESLRHRCSAAECRSSACAPSSLSAQSMGVFTMEGGGGGRKVRRRGVCDVVWGASRARNEVRQR